MVENNEYLEDYDYYIPKEAGVFLLLFYDTNYEPYLTDKSKGVLRRYLSENISALIEVPLITGVSKEMRVTAERLRTEKSQYPLYLRGNRGFVNKAITPLMYRYAVDRLGLETLKKH